MARNFEDDFAGRPLIVGGGLAGMMAALSMQRPSVLLCPARPGEASSSMLAQGGISACVAADDTFELHIADTLAAGDGLCDESVVARIIPEGPDVIALLERYGVVFDRDAAGQLIVGQEAAHSRRRVVHACGDSTGAAVVKALAEQIRQTPRIRVIQGELRKIILHEGEVCGWEADIGGRRLSVGSPAIVLATGGVGGLFPYTTNVSQATGSGLALAARAGAVIADPEFVQFHPTALAVGNAQGRMPLISEAVRGEGAFLLNERDERFTNELAPRDVVARAIQAHLSQGHQVFLDARTLPGLRFAERFPGIDVICRGNGIDPSTMLIPVRPAVHYHMGGVATDACGRSTVKGLWACGEVASTGLHGANRLASNSLLEAAVMGRAVACDIDASIFPRIFDYLSEDRLVSENGDVLPAVRDLTGKCLGILRDEPTLWKAEEALRPMAEQSDAALVALMMVCAARQRKESRGAHARTDYPHQATTARRTFMTMSDCLGHVGKNTLSFHSVSEGVV